MAMKKIYIFHIITSLILFASVAVIFMVLGIGKSTFSPETASTETIDLVSTVPQGEVRLGAVPFTIEEFERAEYC